MKLGIMVMSDTDTASMVAQFFAMNISFELVDPSVIVVCGVCFAGNSDACFLQYQQVYTIISVNIAGELGDPCIVNVFGIFFSGNSDVCYF